MRKKTVKKTVRKQEWEGLRPSQKIQYIWDYYKLHLFIAAVLLYGIFYAVYRQASHKEVLLYTALVNVAAGDTLLEHLSEDFYRSLPDQPPRSEVQLYTGWYLTDDPSADTFTYTQASQMKILASIDAEQLDVILFDREAFDAFAQNGYLYNLEEFCDVLSETPEVSGGSDPAGTASFVISILNDHQTEGMEIIEDNAKEIALDPTVAYQSVTRTYPMAVDLSDSRFIREAGFTEPVYLGILANTPRIGMVSRYLAYLFQES